jgi:uncharacterized damage-inducible protein DinB
MRTQDLQALYEYVIESRTRFLEQSRALGWTEFTRDRGASWGSMLLVYLHMLDDEEGWLMLAEQGGSSTETPDRKAESYRNFDEVAADSARVDGLTRARLARLTDEQLAQEVTLRFPEPFQRTRERIIVHALLDEVAHLGEFVCLFWQQKVPAPFIDWLDFRVGA